MSHLVAGHDDDPGREGEIGVRVHGEVHIVSINRAGRPDDGVVEDVEDLRIAW